VDSSCLRITLNWDLARMRSNSLSTRGCGERMQTVSFVEVRFVVTVRQIIENWPKGQVLWCVCSRIVTDIYDVWLRGTSFNRISIMQFAVWPPRGEECGIAPGIERSVRPFAIRAKKAPVQCVGIGIGRETWGKIEGAGNAGFLWYFDHFVR
jgi:hypothetical protein